MHTQATTGTTAIIFSSLIVAIAPDECTAASYKALKCPAPTGGSTWAAIDRDGANRRVEPYLSSLGKGEAGTGVVTSPPFKIATDEITFTLCGHDGPSGGRGENFIALVDARKGNTLLKTAAPGNDAMQARTWDVSDRRGEEVRIELRDDNAGGGFAWLGVGQIDAGPALTVDFRKGVPETWSRPVQSEDVRYERLENTVPFRRAAGAYTLIPKSGSVDIPCGSPARRLFFLGCTVPDGKPLERYGDIEIHYTDGTADVIPLLCGFTLDGANKRLSRSDAMHLHPSADPFQHYLVVKPRDAVIERIRLTSRPDNRVPRITAITCETTAESDVLIPLPVTEPDTGNAARAESRAVSPGTLDIGRIEQQIRAAHNIRSANDAS